MAHSVVRWDDAKRRAHHERFMTVAREASMQSRRTRVPIVDPVTALDALLSHPALVVGDATTTPVAELTTRLADPVGGEWCAVVGPEGGFAPDERAALASASPYPPLAIGSHVLRAETAALAVAAVLTSLR
jgi:16S rRNA (uracil1498-N3)-methyltransferase